MKRTYITPSTETVNVVAEQMIALSFSEDNEFGSGLLNDEYVDGEVLSKELDFDLW